MVSVSHITKNISLWLSDNSGSTAIEYAGLGALIAVAIAGTVNGIGPNLDGLYISLHEMFVP